MVISRKKRLLSLLLVVLMLITSLPNVFADTNIGKGDTDPIYGDGVNAWMMGLDNGKLLNAGLRVSLYWAKDEEAFVNGEAIRLGEIKDIFPDDVRYRVEMYTDKSVYDYMNPINPTEHYRAFKGNYSQSLITGKSAGYETMISSMPDIMTGTQEEWVNWIEKPVQGEATYNGIDKFTGTTGHEVTPEDFKSGVRRREDGSTEVGTYKIFLEPLASMVVNGDSVVMSLRDAIAWEHDYAKGLITTKKEKNSSGVEYNATIINSLGPAIPLLANSYFLVEDEPTIQMEKNTGYRAPSSGSGYRDRLRSEIAVGGEIYNSMGVGVVSTPENLDRPTVIITKSKVVGYDSEGKYILEEFGEAEKHVIQEGDINFDEETGVYHIEGIKEFEGGTGFVNDILTSDKDLTKLDNIEDIEWVDKMPKGDKSEITFTSDDISRYLLGIVSSYPVEEDDILLTLEGENVVSTDLFLRTNDDGSGKEAKDNFLTQAVELFGREEKLRYGTTTIKDRFSPKKEEEDEEEQELFGHRDFKMKHGVYAEKEYFDNLDYNDDKVITEIEKRREQLSRTSRPEGEGGGIDVADSAKEYLTDNTGKTGGGSKEVISKDDDSIYLIDNPFTEGNAGGNAEQIMYIRVAKGLEAWSSVPMHKKDDIIIEIRQDSYYKESLELAFEVLTDANFSLQEDINNTVSRFAPDKISLMNNYIDSNNIEGINSILMGVGKDWDNLLDESDKQFVLNLYEKHYDTIMTMHENLSKIISNKGDILNQKEISKVTNVTNSYMQIYSTVTSGIGESIEMDSNDRVEGKLGALEVEEKEVVKDENLIEEENRASSVALMTNGSYNVAYLRYIVIPHSTQINVIEHKENGVPTGLVTVEAGVALQDVVGTDIITRMQDIRGTTYPDATLQSWYVDSNLEYDESLIPRTATNSNYPNDGSYNMTTLQDIRNLVPGDNIYVFWDLDVTIPVGPSGDVPEWRLSQYDGNFVNNGRMRMDLLGRVWGYDDMHLSNSGSYRGRYETRNPNNLVTGVNDTPSNMKVSNILNAPWYQSKITSTRTNSSVSLGSRNATVYFDANINKVKTEGLGNYRVANWVSNNTPSLITELDNHGIASGVRGVEYTGPEQETKVSDLQYRMSNTSTYTQWYRDWIPGTPGSPGPPPIVGTPGYWGSWGSRVLTPSYTYYPSSGGTTVETVFDRYVPVNTDARMLNNVSPVKDEDNGRTTIAIQEDYELELYPEVAMLFENENGNRSVVFVSGDLPRKIKPISYFSMEHKVNVSATSVGTSTATDSRAKAEANRIGLGNKQVVYKGAGVNTSFDVRDTSGGSDRGYLEVKSYLLDIRTPSLKSAWGNSFNVNTEKENFLNMWSFSGQARSKLEVTVPNGTGLAYDGPFKQNPINYERDTESRTEYNLTVRGGVVSHVNGTPIATIQASNPELYEALEGMKLVGASKDATVLSTLERQRGKLLTEDTFRTMAASSRNGVTNDLVIDRGWYNEDTTELVVVMYTTRYKVPKTMFSDKLPMSITGLETPVNKSQFFSRMSLGYVYLDYTIESNNIPGLGRVKTYFEMTTRNNSIFNTRESNYGVPNVSILDTSGLW